MGTATRTAHGEGDAPIAGAPIVIARLSRGFVVTHRVERASLPADLLQAHQTLAPNIELDASTAHRTALLRVADVSRPRTQADLPTSVAEDGRVKAAVAGRAVSAAISVVESFDLAVDDAVVLNDSNRLVVRLMPCDVIARVVPLGYRVFAAAVGAEREVQVVRRLAAADAPLAALDRRVEPRVFVRDGFEIDC